MPGILKHSASENDRTLPDPTTILFRILDQLDNTPFEFANYEIHTSRTMWTQILLVRFKDLKTKKITFLVSNKGLYSMSLTN